LAIVFLLYSRTDLRSRTGDTSRKTKNPGEAECKLVGRLEIYMTRRMVKFQKSHCIFERSDRQRGLVGWSAIGDLTPFRSLPMKMIKVILEPDLLRRGRRVWFHSGDFQSAHTAGSSTTLSGGSPSFMTFTISDVNKQHPLVV